MTILTTVMTPLTSYAAEMPPEDKKPPLYEEVKDFLDKDEVVKAEDLELDYGSSFDVKIDFTKIEIPDNLKVKVTFEEAKNEAGEDFDVNKSDTYKAVYYVEPVNQEHPKYQISRKLIVKEAPQTEAQTEVQSESQDNGGDSGEETADDGEADSETSGYEALVGIEILELPPVETEYLVETEDVEIEAMMETETDETELAAETEGEMETSVDDSVADEGYQLTEEEFDAELEATEDQETVDPETGITLSEVMEEAIEQDINLSELEIGETITFEMPMLLAASAETGSQSVDITRGSWYYYSDYGLGSYQTAPYHVKWGGISATAYCVQPSKSGPDDGKYTITKLSDSKTLAKVCYYGTKASDENGFFDEKHPDFSTGKRFIITHIAAAYANGSSDWDSGTNSTGRNLAMELYNYCVSMPEIPDVEMSFSDDDVKAYVEGKIQRTKEITFSADKLQTVTFKLPAGVKLVNVTTGKTSAAGAEVEISGGTHFYLTAPMSQATDVSESFSTKMRGSIDKEYSAYKITTGSSSQDLALVFGEGVGNEKYINFKVSWLKECYVSIVKKNADTSKAVAGAIYGIYSDEACTNLIKQMPATDANGASQVMIEKTQDTVYLKEISVPAGYVLDAKAYNINLVVGETTTKNVTDKEQYANLTIYKEGEVLTGANVTDSGVVFQYTKQRLKGAVYNVYAGADITSADGTVIYKKDALVKEGLTTGEDGSATLQNLHLGTYVVTETKAPADYVCKGESKTITLSYAGQSVEVAVGNVTFSNDRQKASVSVMKQDDTTKNPLAGGIYGLYAAEDIADVSGNVVVRKDTLIEKATTGNDGNAVYQADLPINHNYYVKEVQAPENYFRNSDAVFTFNFKYTNDKQTSVAFSYTFANEHVNATIQLVKKDKETGSNPQGDAVFEGAVYGVYAREDIVHPDGKTGVLYKAGSQVATMTVDKAGNASVEDLYLGKYYVKEITAPPDICWMSTSMMWSAATKVTR